MDVTPFVLRLRAQAAGAFAEIAASADLDAAMDAPGSGAAAYLVPLAEDGEDSPLVSVHRQRLEQAFGVVIRVQNLQDASGIAAAADLHTKRMAVRQALLGWVPDTTNGEPVRFAAGAILQFKEQRLWWQDVFRVATYAMGA